MIVAGHVVAIAAGIALVVWVLFSAVRQVIVPRGDPVLLSRLVFVALRRIFFIWVKRAKTYEDRDRAMAYYSPTALIVLPGVWAFLVIIGFTAVFWGLGVDPLRRAFSMSGSSLTTLGNVPPPNLPTTEAAFIEATLGLGLIALLISYLPSIYAAFQRRELGVAELATRAGDPPSAVEMIVRHHRLQRLDALDDIWDEWEKWFADIEETHTSQPSLVFFRSISHERSWITSAGVLLDVASLRASTLDLPRNPRAELCIRAGYLALRRIASYFAIPFDPDPKPDDPIAVDRSEFDDAYDRLVADGVPVRTDREQAWRDFKGWRVNYDPVLIALAGLTMAPYAAWSSDRSTRYRRPPFLPRRARRRAARAASPPLPTRTTTQD
jgi:hypothetical protein